MWSSGTCLLCWRQRDAIFPALIAALVCLVVVSALTPPPKAAQVALFFLRG